MNRKTCTDIAESIIQIGQYFPKTKDYFIHAKKNIHTAYNLWKAAVLLFMHGVCPIHFKKSGDDLIRDIYYEHLLKKIRSRRRTITYRDVMELSR
jgi:hypothetical protein